jgi:Enolase, C-terminal TIM barrel domain
MNGWGRLLFSNEDDCRAIEAEKRGFVRAFPAHGSRLSCFASIGLGERVGKFNQLLRIERQLGASAQFAGRTALKC